MVQHIICGDSALVLPGIPSESVDIGLWLC